MDFFDTIELDNLIHKNMNPLPVVSKIMFQRYLDFTNDTEEHSEDTYDFEEFQYTDDYYWDSIKIEFDWESNKHNYYSDSSSSDSEYYDE